MPTVALPRPVHLAERQDRGAVVPQTEVITMDRDHAILHCGLLSRSGEARGGDEDRDIGLEVNLGP